MFLTPANKNIMLKANWEAYASMRNTSQNIYTMPNASDVLSTIAEQIIDTYDMFAAIGNLMCDTQNTLAQS